MKCPRDGSTLEPIHYEANIEVDQCPTCHGMWLDKGELEQIQQTIEHDYTKELEKEPDHVRRAYALARPTHLGEAPCPKCGEGMVVKEYAYTSQVLIDVCPEDHGIWLDAGEIQALEVFFERMRKDAKLAEDSRKGLWGTLRQALRRG